MTPHELQQLAFGFRGARAISCALELGVYRVLGRDALGADDVAGRCGTDARGMRILLDALVGLGVLERCDDRYRLTAELVPALVEGEPGYLGNLLLHDLWHWSSWARLDQAVRDGARPAPLPGDAHLARPEILARFLPNYVEAMEQSVGDAARTLAERLAALEPRRPLDLGGGSGANLIALCHALPQARGLLAELPFVLERAHEQVRQAGLASRIELVALDFDKDAIPAGHDLILLSRVLMGLAPERAAKLVAACAAALAPGGWLAIHDYAKHTRVGALLSLDMLLNTGGEVHGTRRIGEWLEHAGLERIGCLRVLPYTRLQLARKPAERAAP